MPNVEQGRSRNDSQPYPSGVSVSLPCRRSTLSLIMNWRTLGASLSSRISIFDTLVPLAKSSLLGDSSGLLPQDTTKDLHVSCIEHHGRSKAIVKGVESLSQVKPVPLEGGSQSSITPASSDPTTPGSSKRGIGEPPMPAPGEEAGKPGITCDIVQASIGNVTTGKTTVLSRPLAHSGLGCGLGAYESDHEHSSSRTHLGHCDNELEPDSTIEASYDETELHDVSENSTRRPKLKLRIKSRPSTLSTGDITSDPTNQPSGGNGRPVCRPSQQRKLRIKSPRNNPRPLNASPIGTVVRNVGMSTGLTIDSIGQPAGYDIRLGPSHLVESIAPYASGYMQDDNTRRAEWDFAEDTTVVDGTTDWTGTACQCHLERQSALETRSCHSTLSNDGSTSLGHANAVAQRHRVRWRFCPSSTAVDTETQPRAKWRQGRAGSPLASKGISLGTRTTSDMSTCTTLPRVGKPGWRVRRWTSRASWVVRSCMCRGVVRSRRTPKEEAS